MLSLAAAASVVDYRGQRRTVHRNGLGAVAAGARDFLFLPDSHGLAAAAFDGVAAPLCRAPVEMPRTADAFDTIRAAERMREAGCAVVMTLGGDGTNRALALGWRDAPL